MADNSHEAFASNTYFDRSLNMQAVKLLPGEFHVTNKDMVQVTVLGSCVAACIRDRINNIGGMNHFMLPDCGQDGPSQYGVSARYGVYAMEILINELMKLGASRKSLEAKVFGGGNVMESLMSSNVGQRNADFVLEFLATEGIKVVAKDLVDIHPRKVYHFPSSGRVRVKKLMSLRNDTVAEREQDYSTRLIKSSSGGDVELFG